MAILVSLVDLEKKAREREEARIRYEDAIRPEMTRLDMIKRGRRRQEERRREVLEQMKIKESEG